MLALSYTNLINQSSLVLFNAFMIGITTTNDIYHCFNLAFHPSYAGYQPNRKNVISGFKFGKSC